VSGWVACNDQVWLDCAHLQFIVATGLSLHTLWVLCESADAICRVFLVIEFCEPEDTKKIIYFSFIYFSYGASDIGLNNA